MRIANIPHRFIPKWDQYPDTIVIHSLAEFIDFDTVDKTGWRHVDDLGLAAHFYVYPSGAIVQSLDIGKQGAHAKGHNGNTIGIEFIVPGLHTYQSFTKKLMR